MFAFLLVVPFNTGWKQVDGFERTVYFVTLLVVALAAFLLMAPPIHHRLLFRHGEKPFLIWIGNYMAIGGMICLGLGFVGILVLISDVVVGGAAPAMVGVLALALVAWLWFVLPLARRRRNDGPATQQDSRSAGQGPGLDWAPWRPPSTRVRSDHERLVHAGNHDRAASGDRPEGGHAGVHRPSRHPAGARG